MRSATEINANKDIELTGNEANLVAYYKFNDGSGQIATDQSSTTNNAVLGNSNTAYTDDPSWVKVNHALTSVSSYRYGFNGMEKDDSIKGEGNSLDFGARIYDPRLGRWLSPDPLEAKYPGITPYNFAFNNPIIFVDPDGADGRLTVKQTEAGGTITLETTVHLYGKDAGLVNLESLNNKAAALATPTTVEIDGKVWEVSIKITYVLTPEIEAEINKVKPERGKDENGGMNMGMMSDLSEEFIKSNGIEVGDNIMEVSSGIDIGKAKGIAVQGGNGAIVGPKAFTNLVGNLYFMGPGEGTSIHEPLHMLGFDERYDSNPENGLTPHPDMYGDYMDNSDVKSTFHSIHYVDIIKAVLEFSNGENMEGQLFDGKIDDTNGGDNAASQGDVNSAKAAVKK